MEVYVNIIKMPTKTHGGNRKWSFPPVLSYSSLISQPFLKVHFLTQEVTSADLISRHRIFIVSLLHSATKVLLFLLPPPGYNQQYEFCKPMIWNLRYKWWNGSEWKELIIQMEFTFWRIVCSCCSSFKQKIHIRLYF